MVRGAGTTGKGSIFGNSQSRSKPFGSRTDTPFPTRKTCDLFDILSQTPTKLTFRVPAGVQLISLSLHFLTSERDRFHSVLFVVWMHLCRQVLDSDRIRENSRFFVILAKIGINSVMLPRIGVILFGKNLTSMILLRQTRDSRSR